MSALDDAADEGIRPERDRWGRPLLLSEAGVREPYTRMSTMAGYLDDDSALVKWQARLQAIGLGRRPDLTALLASLPAIHSDVAGAGRPTRAQLNEDRITKAAIDEIIWRAQEAALVHAKADWGTAVHQLVEHGGEAPERMAKDVDAVRRVLDRFEIMKQEGFVVNDRWMAAGSFDVLGRLKGTSGLPRIIDLKTGRLSVLAHMVQTAGYAGGTPYDVMTDTRGVPFAERVDQRVGYVIHAPAGQGVADLIPLDLEEGRRGLEAAVVVREWRRDPGRGVLPDDA